MSNKQNFTTQLMDEWQKQVQEYLNDPRVAELMVDYYAKFQHNIQQFSQSFTDQSPNDVSNGADISPDAMARIEALEARVKLLEHFLAQVFGQCNKPK